MKPVKGAVITKTLHILRKDFEIIGNIRYLFMLEKEDEIRIGERGDIRDFFFKLRKLGTKVN